MPVFAAADLGASGGRVIRGVVDRERILLETVHRFDNGVMEVDGHLRWDLPRLYEQVVVGLDRVPEAVSIGIDTWGVDYGLLDAAGQLLAQPVAYRDDRTAKVIDAVHDAISPEELYAITGVQHLPFNTIYQLAVERQGPLWDRAKRIVLLPDLIAYWLTGELRTEVTNASTTALLDARSRAWSDELLDRLSIARDLLPDLAPPGEIRGSTRRGIPVTTVGSHDTASAVVGVPATNPNFAYVASGTWSLVGLELSEPILNEEARAANFTNEAGVDGRTRFLRNVGGLWLLQECIRAWGGTDLEKLLASAAARSRGGPIVDVDDSSFIAPGGMPERIAKAAGRAQMTRAETVRCILDSLAAAYARTLERAVELSGAAVEVLHIVGGGSQNALLCQLTADATHLPVIAGPTEATALGNVLIQARAHGSAPGTLEEMRERIADTMPLRRYEPS